MELHGHVRIRTGDVSGVAAGLITMTREFASYRYAIRAEGNNKIAIGPEFELDMIPAPQGNPRELAIWKELNRPKDAPQIVKISDTSELRFDGDSAIWFFEALLVAEGRLGGAFQPVFNFQPFLSSLARLGGHPPSAMVVVLPAGHSLEPSILRLRLSDKLPIGGGVRSPAVQSRNLRP
jgi:hypothetical protein